MTIDFIALGAATFCAFTSYRFFSTVLEPHHKGAYCPKVRCKNPLKARVMTHFADGSGSAEHKHKYSMGNLVMSWKEEIDEERKKKAASGAKLLGLPPCGYRLFNLRRLMVYNARDLEHVLVRNGRNYVKGVDGRRVGGYKILAEIFGGKNLFLLCDEEEHAQQRKAINPAFSPLSLRTLANTIFVKHVAQMVDVLKKSCASKCHDGHHGKADFMWHVTDGDLIQETTFNIIMEAAFCTDSDEARKVSKPYMETKLGSDMIFRLLPGYKYLPSEFNTLVNTSRGVLMDTAEQVSAEVRQRGPPKEGEAKSLIDYLVYAGLSKEAMLDNCIAFMFAGHETTNTAMKWFVYCMAAHPRVQEKLFEELECFMSLGATPAIEDFARLTYLPHVINEVLRMFPPVSIVAREAAEDDVLPSSHVFVPKGLIITAHVLLVQRSKEIYGDDANEFVPERWEDPELRQRVGEAGFMPFLIGKRNCIGKNFALQELSLMAASLVRNFRLEWPDGQPHPRRVDGVVMRPSPYDVALHLRTE